MTSEETMTEAYAAFDKWLREQPEEVQDMNVLDQITLYGAATTDAVD